MIRNNLTFILTFTHLPRWSILLKSLHSNKKFSVLLNWLRLQSFKQVLAKQVYSLQHMVTHTQHCFTDKVTLKLTVYGGDTCPHQQKELHRQEYIPVMRFFQHPNVFTSRKINGTAVISLVFISKQYEYESLFSSLPTAQFKLKICSLSKGLICHRFELWPCFFESTANPQPRAAKNKI